MQLELMYTGLNEWSISAVTETITVVDNKVFGFFFLP